MCNTGRSKQSDVKFIVSYNILRRLAAAARLGAAFSNIPTYLPTLCSIAAFRRCLHTVRTTPIHYCNKYITKKIYVSPTRHAKSRSQVDDKTRFWRITYTLPIPSEGFVPVTILAPLTKKNRIFGL